MDNDPNMSRADSNGVLPEVVHKSWMKLARWEWFISAEMTSNKIESILAAMRRATEANPRWSKAWRHTGLFNVAAMNHFAITDDNKKAHSFVAPAINAFFKSISFNRFAWFICNAAISQTHNLILQTDDWLCVSVVPRSLGSRIFFGSSLSGLIIATPKMWNAH